MKVTFECQHCHKFHLLEEMYYCLNCDQFLCSCSSCVFAELDYCYCPVCFKLMVTTEVYRNHYHCSRCYSCPQCKSQLVAKEMEETNEESTFSIFWVCNYCGWNSVDCKLKGKTIADLEKSTLELLNQIEEKNQKSIQSACKCICDDFHLSSSHSFSYPIPLTEINSFKTQQQKEHEQEIHHLQDSISYISSTRIPQPVLLRSKSTISCLECKSNNKPSILVKPHVQPLIGDSSMSKGYEMWLRVANLALFTIPSISLIKHDDQFVILRFSHPSYETKSNVSGMISVTMTTPELFSFVIPNMDVLTYDKHELEELNKNNQHVLRTDMTSTVIQLFTKNSKHIQMNFSISYKTFKGIDKEHNINCNIDF